MAALTPHQAIVFLAEAVAPDEVDVAPDMLDAARAGTNPQAAGGDALGGFGNLGAVVSEVWSVCAAFMEVLPKLAPYVAPASATVTIGRAFADLLRRRKAAPAQSEVVQRLDAIVDLLKLALADKGLPPERSAALASETMRAFTRSPEAAESILDALADRDPV